MEQSNRWKMHRKYQKSSWNMKRYRSLSVHTQHWIHNLPIYQILLNTRSWIDEREHNKTSWTWVAGGFIKTEIKTRKTRNRSQILMQSSLVHTRTLRKEYFKKKLLYEQPKHETKWNWKKQLLLKICSDSDNMNIYHIEFIKHQKLVYMEQFVCVYSIIDLYWWQNRLEC